MTVQPLPTSANKFMTRLAFAYEYKIPYTIVVDRVRRGELAVHFIDGKIQINVEEALKACERKRPSKVARDPSVVDLFSA
jgi:hypothetical protein